MSFQNHRGWKFFRLLFGEALGLMIVCFVVVAFANATNLGRPGSGYPGYLFFVGTVGALMAYHRSQARRAVCLVALLLALIGLHSEKLVGEAQTRKNYRLQAEQMRRNYEHLIAEGETKPPDPIIVTP